MRISTLFLVAVAVLSTVFFWVSNGKAQTPVPQPNIPLERSGAVYRFACQPVEPASMSDIMCAVRTDLPGDPLELGCETQTGETALDIIVIEITVERTPMQDAQIRCRAIDAGLNPSDLSDNYGIADFTPPGRPWVTVHP